MERTKQTGITNQIFKLTFVKRRLSETRESKTENGSDGSPSAVSGVTGSR